MTTASALFGASRGRPVPPGPHVCYFCGVSCDAALSVDDHVSESFMDWDSVRAPGSRHVCAGCAESMRSDIESVEMIDGEIKRPKDGSTRLIQIRWFSWLLYEGRAYAATPAHRDRIASLCLSPPATPFAICIADGNKHQLFRTPLNHSRKRVVVNCEGTIVVYSPDDLRDRLTLAMRVVGVCGKGGDSLDRLMDPRQNMSVALQLNNADVSLFPSWLAVRDEPLTTLAVWLCPGKEDCLDRLASAENRELQRG